MSDDDVEIRKQFRDAVNMSPTELAAWLETDESQLVGDTGGDGESTGHRSGRRIIELKDKAVDQLTDDDHAWMNKVVGRLRQTTPGAALRRRHRRDELAVLAHELGSRPAKD